MENLECFVCRKKFNLVQLKNVNGKLMCPSCKSIYELGAPIAETIGARMAEALLHQSYDKQKTFECEACGFPISPTAGSTKIRCPNCDTEYRRMTA